MAFTKETAIELLAKGNIAEFNEKRTYNESELLDLSEVDFTEFEVTGANLSYSDLSNANFSEMELQNINFSNSDLTSSSFLRATLTDIEFSGTVLNGAIFTGSTCQANFADADLSGADFCDGDFSESDFTLSENMSMCKFDAYTVWPDNSNLPDDFDSEYIKESSEDDDEPTSADYY